ncbi:hypothetical protein IMG5_066590 [Ichthyophthirius multifiliis]|uniref:Cyclic nucleotide-binding domain-containing protein n=1 Tax=Ichthyophthirius multifiliis TaxID=5932 RepID=G0QPD0_ICHMU|nr:hypothetical protein IMG5_066590 [Ichthyophthirius multifiliis]EGR32930.1 hypothetical protein IMG5_066590 [Ichthyophthirius multifiliis]|eukprot:XP_004036916.1 hypothetical protein IMG5_066590 [Ichthyophthirius multifiliis]
MHKVQIQNSDNYTKYVNSVYFAAITIGTIGYGDITPNNNLEQLFVTFIAILSSGIFAYILSNIQNVFREYNEKQEYYRLQLIDLNNYMTSREVNPQLQQMARKYLKYVNEQGYRSNKIPSDSLNGLSQILKKEIQHEIALKSIHKIKFLSNNFSKKFLDSLSDAIKEINFGPDEIIMKNDQHNIPCLYLILKGTVDIYMDNGKKNNNSIMNEIKQFSRLRQNQIFGLYEFLSQNYYSQTSARSIGVTTIHYIELDQFIKVLNQYPNDRETYFNMKDNINLYNSLEDYKLMCYSCKSNMHLIKDCPLFFYKPKNQRVLNIFLKEQQQFIKQFKRNMVRQKFATISQYYYIKEDIQFYQDENQIVRIQDEFMDQYDEQLKNENEFDVQKIYNNSQGQQKQKQTQNVFQKKKSSNLKNLKRQISSKLGLNQILQQNQNYYDIQNQDDNQQNINKQKQELINMFIQQTRNQNNLQGLQGNDIEMHFDFIRIFNIYMAHNNVQNVLLKYNRFYKIYRSQLKIKKKNNIMYISKKIDQNYSPRCQRFKNQQTIKQQ